MQDEQLTYVMGSEIGPLLCKGFAFLYREQPEYPVRKLAEWLLAQGRRQIDGQQISQREAEKAHLSESLCKIQEEKARQKVWVRLKQDLEMQIETWEQRRDRFRKDLVNAEYPEDCLEQWLPEYLEKEYGLAACYVGLLGHQRKTPIETDEDENAHVDLEAPKAVSYIGTSKSSREVMLGRVLPPEKGISLDVFKEDPPADGEEGANAPKDIRQKYIYVPNVLKEERVFYFKIPKLGSYAVFSMVLPNVLAEELLDKNCEQYKKYVSDKEEAEKARANELAAAKSDLQQLDKKQDEAVRASEEYANLRKQLQELENKPAPQTKPMFQSSRKQYLVGCDTLGQDREIPKAALLEIQQLVADFVQLWESTQQRQLIHDIGLVTNNPAGPENAEMSEHILEEVEAQVNSKLAGIKERTTDEKEISYEADCCRLSALKRVFQEKGMKGLAVYQQFFVPKYKSALQAVMLFAGYRKQEINLRGTNLLDWRKVKGLISEQLVERVIDYDHEGVKPGDIPGYAKIGKLQQRMDKLDLEGILGYNISLWMLVKVAKMSLSLRVAERDLLVEKYEAKKRDRESKQEQTTRIMEEREKALEAHKATIEPDQLQSFNEVEWLAAYDSEHPLPAIPEEPQLTQYTDI